MPESSPIDPTALSDRPEGGKKDGLSSKNLGTVNAELLSNVYHSEQGFPDLDPSIGVHLLRCTGGGRRTLNLCGNCR